ncbi:MAG: nuclear transport factor 2 family protein [Cruoricaptor ignavus]|nr:nuclear transport factor 2 family protein [Cruoricaptor ignavus]
MNPQILEQLNDKTAIRELIDLYANYADTKQTEKQAALFTDDYTVALYYDSTSETPTQTVTGKDNLKQLFIDNLSPFPKTMHLNGQSIITLDDETASGIVYCRAYHQSIADGKEQFMIAAIRYEDEYRKANGKWYFQSRKLLVQWIENR